MGAESYENHSMPKNLYVPKSNYLSDRESQEVYYQQYPNYPQYYEYDNASGYGEEAQSPEEVPVYKNSGPESSMHNTSRFALSNERRAREMKNADSSNFQD
jgi:hypothetical protein